MLEGEEISAEEQVERFLAGVLKAEMSPRILHTIA